MLDLRHLWRKRDTCNNVETHFVEKRQLCRVETLLEEKRHKCAKKRDTSVGVETRLEEQSHMCRQRDTFWRERDTCVNVETHLVEKRYL